jgi:5-methylcytosine-specific restriction endonuclease McrA
MTGRVLVLNASFEPINVCTERRAVVMIFKGVARVEEHNGHILHSEKLSIHAPSVIRLTEYIHIPFERRSLSRKNILLRDHNDARPLRDTPRRVHTHPVQEPLALAQEHSAARPLDVPVLWATVSTV